MTRTEPGATCVYCERFSIAGHPELAAAGQGWCSVWERATPWHGQIGVLFKEARDRAPRARYVAQQQDKTNETEKS